MIDQQLISISLFSGGFGLDLGLEKAGFKTVACVESDPDSIQTIALNQPELKLSCIARDIRAVTAQTLLEEGGKTFQLNRALQPGEVDLITGGPPCQPFSTAGKRNSMNDPRGSLFMDFIRIVREVQPRFFIMENVRGLLSAAIKHRPLKERGAGYPPLELEEQPGSALKVILGQFHNLGYSVIYQLLEAADYGVPQNRQRVIFIGSRDGESLSFPPPSHAKNSNTLPIWRSLQFALTNLEDSQPDFVPYSAKRLQYLKLLKAGQNWRSLPKELQPEAMGGAYQSGGGKVGFYRRLAWDKPSPTITTSPHQKATDMCHPVELRPLSVRECARIQTFPDDWQFCGSITSKYRQIGNAVPVKLAEAIGQHLVRIATGDLVAKSKISVQLSLFDLQEFNAFHLSNRLQKTIFLALAEYLPKLN
ncbi:MAG: DNA cytosine methyltransferase [Spirulinaceae cyanobacterium]